MGHVIEVAKTGRAKCRKCKQAIAKDELRFGEEAVNAFAPDGGMTYRWYHLACAATACPAELGQSLAAHDGEIPDRAALEQQIAEGKRKQKPKTFPFAERAPSGRSTCIECERKIEKDELRIAIEREIETGSFMSRGAGYLHPACAVSHLGDDALAEKIRGNSTQLSPEELEQVVGQLEGT